MREFNGFAQVPELQRLSKPARDGFERFAMRVHCAGLDWYFADETYCWGSRGLQALSAKVRLGRVLVVDGEPKLTVSVRTNGKQVLQDRHRQHLQAVGRFDDANGRYIVPLEQAPRIIEGPEGEEVLETALGIADAGVRAGWFPIDYERSHEERAHLEEKPPLASQAPNVIGMPPGLSLRCWSWRRKGHDAFRRAVVRHWASECAVHGQVNTSLLVASHIVPWSDADKNERTDPSNGLLLSVSIDALFDGGLISFDDEGRVLHRFGPGDPTPQAFGLHLESRIRHLERLTAEAKRYLARHRQRHGF